MSYPDFTTREREVGKLLANGWENDVIAKELHISMRTVKSIINRMFLRAGIKEGIKRVKLATLCYRMDIEGKL